MKPEENFHEWLKKAEEDYQFACSTLPDSNFYAQICFHFQQAAEKYLKAYIVANNLEFRKIHELRQLLKICEKHNSSFSKLRDECDFLSPFYIDTRYPVHWPAEVSKEEAEKAKEAAQALISFIKKHLP